MHAMHDQWAKRIAVEIYDLITTTSPEHEVPALDAQRMDLWIEPQLPLPPAPPAVLRWCFAIAARPAQLEFFSDVPDSEEVRGCQRKQLQWHHLRRQKARKDKQPPPDIAPVWVVTPGRPVACFSRLRVQAAPGWPPGVYHTDSYSEQWFLVLNELPKTRETVLLRLMGSQRLRLEALQELAQLPADDPEVAPLRDALALLQEAVRADITIPEEEKGPFMTQARAEVLRRDEQNRREGRQEGQREGRQEGQRATLQRLYQLRLGPVPTDVVQALTRIEDPAQLDDLVAVFANGDAQTIAARLGS